MNCLKRIFTFFVAAFSVLAAVADSENQADERINPQLEVSEQQRVDYSRYRFLKPERNHIDLNGADWSALAERFAAARDGDTIFTIVYLGDSHIQADFGGSVLRERMAAEAGSAGRGLIIPFKIAGTNQPVDYTITTGTPTVSSRLLKQPWPTDMPFTGIGVQPVNEPLMLHVTAKEPFDRLRLYHRGGEPNIAAIYGEDITESIDFEPEGPLQVYLSEPRTDIHINIEAPSGFVLAGLSLAGAEAGTFVHSIGNNGATYSTYNGIDHFAQELSGLSPDLIIVALGTNEAFGAFESSEMRLEVDLLVKSIRAQNPDAQLLLVTPSECYRKRYRWRHGKRREVGQTVNTKVKQARNVVKNYAEDHGVPLYDTYNILGGDGSAARMKSAVVLGRDGVHFTSEGYRLQGSLLADALLEVLNP